MPLSERALGYMWDMLHRTRQVVEFTRDRSCQEYRENGMLCLAVERAVEIIGEAARNVSPEARAGVPEVAWKKIVATRHILAHEYGEINHDVMWRIATVHVPELIAILGPLLAQHPPGAESGRDPRGL
jgi:uncharacterized protein with HEPN domain